MEDPAALRDLRGADAGKRCAALGDVLALASEGRSVPAGVLEAVMKLAGSGESDKTSRVRGFGCVHAARAGWRRPGC